MLTGAVPGSVVTLIVVTLVALVIVPVFSIVASTRTPEAKRAREAAAGHEGVKARLGSVFFTFVRAAVFGRSPDEGEGACATYHVWTIGTRGPATVLVRFERGGEASEWTQTKVLLRSWIPFARPRELA